METKIINETKCFIHNKEAKDQIDIIAVRMMEQNEIMGLLPFKYVQQGRKKYFRYDTGKDETLEEWLMRVQSRKDVIQLLTSLIAVSGEAEAWLLIPEQICTDIQFVVVQNNKCKVAYIPLLEKHQGNVLQLVQRIIILVKYALDEDFSYLFDLQNAFGRGDIQNFADLKKWIRIVDGEEEAAMRMAENISVKGERFLSGDELESGNKAAVPVAKEEEILPASKVEVRKDSFEGIFGETGLQSRQEKKKEKRREKKTGEKQGFLFKNQKKNKNGIDVLGTESAAEQKPVSQKQSMASGEIINDLDRGDSTVMMPTGPEPMLVRIKSGMEYRIPGESYVIGSGPQADIIVADNPTVSRKHARVFANNGAYYIEDLGSTNGTCVNGERLRKMEPYKLGKSARIRISNEDYFFEVRKGED